MNVRLRRGKNKKIHRKCGEKLLMGIYKKRKKLHFFGIPLEAGWRKIETTYTLRRKMQTCTALINVFTALLKKQLKNQYLI